MIILNFYEAIHRSPFFVIGYSSFISLLSWYQSCLILCDPCSLWLVSVHLKEQTPLAVSTEWFLQIKIGQFLG